jgi:hypothetical protein
MICHAKAFLRVESAFDLLHLMHMGRPSRKSCEQAFSLLSLDGTCLQGREKAEKGLCGGGTLRTSPGQMVRAPSLQVSLDSQLCD